ncbi:MAG: hypothetical protein WD096_07195 [Actinomycetota bacterium]
MASERTIRSSRRGLRGLVVASGVVLVVAGSIAGFAGPRAGDDRPDHDYAAALSRFGGNPDCPPGKVVGYSDWEGLEERLSSLDPPDGVDLTSSIPAIDFVRVAPDDPRPYLHGKTEVPDGLIAVIPCVEIESGHLVVADPSAAFEPPQDAIEGQPSDT